MKLLLPVLLTSLIFSGCASKKAVPRNPTINKTNQEQAQIILQQQAQIRELYKQLDTQRRTTYKAQVKKTKARVKTKRPIVKQKPIPAEVVQKKEVTLKKVEDTNYSSGYMYPGEKKSVTAKAPAPMSTVSAMTKSECITMIGAAKFSKYTAMFGSESASLKRCAMLKSMNN